jgi:hypothetical protein
MVGEPMVATELAKWQYGNATPLSLDGMSKNSKVCKVQGCPDLMDEPLTELQRVAGKTGEYRSWDHYSKAHIRVKERWII